MADRKEPTPAGTPQDLRSLAASLEVANDALRRLRDAFDLSPFLNPNETAEIIIRRMAWLAEQIRDEEDA